MIPLFYKKKKNIRNKTVHRKREKIEGRKYTGRQAAGEGGPGLKGWRLRAHFHTHRVHLRMERLAAPVDEARAHQPWLSAGGSFFSSLRPHLDPLRLAGTLMLESVCCAAREDFTCVCPVMRETHPQ